MGELSRAQRLAISTAGRDAHGHIPGGTHDGTLQVLERERLMEDCSVTECGCECLGWHLTQEGYLMVAGLAGGG